MRFELRNVYKSFGEKHVLEDVSFSADGGEALGLLGRNGAGKTTTIRIIMDVFRCDSGEVLIDGTPMRRDKINFGYLPEERGLYPKKKIMEQLVYFGVLRGMKTAAAKASARSWLERLEMSEYADKRLDTLSKGNQQKIQLAEALITNPDFVILDEPFSGLDPVNAMMLRDIVREQIQKGSIVLFSSHQMSYVEEFCDNIAILNTGKIVLSGNIAGIKRNYDRRRLVVTTQLPEEIRSALSHREFEACVSGTECSCGEVRVMLREASMKTEFIRLLSLAGVDFDAVRVFEPSLNDIFVAYTEGAI